MHNDLTFDPNLDLKFEKKLSIPLDALWKGWTDPKILKQWFCPSPWKVTECRLDLKPGGEFFTVFEGPEGQRVENDGCVLEVIEKKKLVWTGMMTKGFRPVAAMPGGFQFVATLTFSKDGEGSLYTAVVCHLDSDSKNKHETMGFKEGWGMAASQLEKLMS